MQQRRKIAAWVKELGAERFLTEPPNLQESIKELTDIQIQTVSGRSNGADWERRAVAEAELPIQDSAILRFGNQLKEADALRMVSIVHKQVIPSVTALKLFYDRVRPNWLASFSIANGNTNTSSDLYDWLVMNPGHPAYPSGHASQWHFFAHLIGKHNHHLRDAALEWALEVSRNRERLGLHYPSDTAAGMCLANTLYKKWIQTSTRQEL